MNRIKRAVCFLAALSVTVASVPVNQIYSGVTVYGQVAGLQTTEECVNFSDLSELGMVSDSNYFSQVDFRTSALIGFGKNSDEPFVFTNNCRFYDDIVIDGNSEFRYYETLKFGRNRKLISYGNINIENEIRAEYDGSFSDCSLGEKPSVFCSGSVTSSSLRIGSENNTVNVYCGNIDAPYSGSTLIFGNVFCVDPSAHNVILGGSIYGNVVTAGSFETTTQLRIKGDLFVKGDLIVGDGLSVDGNLYVGGEVICRDSNRVSVTGETVSGTSLDDSVMDTVVFDSDTSDKVTVKSLLEYGLDGKGNVIPEREEYIRCYEQNLLKRESRTAEYENLDLDNVEHLNSEYINTINSSCIIESSSLLGGEIFIVPESQEDIYIFFPDSFYMTQTTFIVDDAAESRCHFVFGKDSLRMNNSRIITRSYYEQIKYERTLSVNDNDIINIEVFAPETCRVTMENSLITGNAFLNPLQVSHGWCGADTIIYNDMTEITEYPSVYLIGTLNGTTSNDSTIVDGNFYYVQPFVPFKIYNQPVDAYGLSGETVSFSVEAEGKELSYQWQYCNPGSETWANSGMAGNRTDTLSVGVLERRNGQRYRCVITDGYGREYITEPAQLILGRRTEIVKQPEDITALAGTTAKFTIEASGDGLLYQWQYCSPGSDEWKNSGMIGYNTSTIKVPVTTARNGQKYRCIITDKYGISVVSREVVLNVYEFAVTVQPEDCVAVSGENAVFNVSATGEKLKYQWQYCSAGKDTWENSGMIGNESDTLTVPVTAVRNGQKYRCIVTDIYGNSITSDEAVLIVASPLKVTKHPESVQVLVGNDAVFRTEADGKDVRYQWQVCPEGKDEWNDSDMSGSNTNELTVAVTSSMNNQKYRCVITDAYGRSVITDEAVLTAEELLVIKTQPKSIRNLVGQDAEFSVGAEGKGIRYQWQYCLNGSEEWQDSSEDGAQTANLVIPITLEKNNNKYRCCLTDDYGKTTVSDEAELTADTSARVVQQPEDYYGRVGTTASFSLAAEGYGLKYQWQYCSPGSDEWKNSGMTGYNTSTIKVPVTTARNGQKYRCIITDNYGKSVISNPVVLAVRKALSISAHPESVCVVYGSTVSLKLTASGDSLTYTWQTKSPSATEWSSCDCSSATLELTVDESMNGNLYRCIVTDKYGESLTSSEATLTVRELPKIITDITDQKVPFGELAKFTVEASGEDVSYCWQYHKKNEKEWIDCKAEVPEIGVIANSESNGNVYRCVVTDKYGEQVISAEASVFTDLTLIKSPFSIIVTEGQNAEFETEAVGKDLNYKWQYSTDFGKTWNDVDGDTSVTELLHFMASIAQNGHMFRCVVSDEAEEKYSDSAMLIVNPKPAAPVIVKQTEGTVSVKSGEKTELSVSATGNGLGSYIWEVSADGGETWTPEGTEGEKLSLEASADKNGYLYHCIVRNAYGDSTVSEPVKLSVYSEGNCGEGVSWNFAEGVLEISGKGDMDVEAGFSGLSGISEVVIGRDITSVSLGSISSDEIKLTFLSFSCDISDYTNNIEAEKVTVCGYAGSTAEEFAENHEFEFVAAEKPELTVNKSNILLKAGDTCTVSTNQQEYVSFESTDTDVAAVSESGEITAVSAGTTQIIVTNDMCDTIVITVTVQEVHDDELSIVKSVYNVAPLDFIEAPASGSELRWSVPKLTDRSKVEITEDGIKALADGSVTVIYRDSYGNTGSVRVNISSQKLNLNERKTVLYGGNKCFRYTASKAGTVHISSFNFTGESMKVYSSAGKEKTVTETAEDNHLISTFYMNKNETVYVKFAAGAIRRSYSVAAEDHTTETVIVEADRDYSGEVSYRKVVNAEFTVEEAGKYDISYEGAVSMQINGDASESFGKMMLCKGDVIRFTAESERVSADYSFSVNRVPLETQTFSLGEGQNFTLGNENLIYEFEVPYDAKYYFTGLVDTKVIVYNDLLAKVTETSVNAPEQEVYFSLEGGKTYYFEFVRSEESEVCSDITFVPLEDNIRGIEIGASETVRFKANKPTWLEYTADKDGVYNISVVPETDSSNLEPYDPSSLDVCVIDTFGNVYAEDTYRTCNLDYEFSEGQSLYYMVKSSVYNPSYPAAVDFSYILTEKETEEEPASEKISAGIPVNYTGTLLEFKADTTGFYKFTNTDYLYGTADKSLIYDNTNTDEFSSGYRYENLCHYLNAGDTVFIQGKDSMEVQVDYENPETSDSVYELKQYYSYRFNCCTEQKVYDWISFTAPVEGEYKLSVETGGSGRPLVKSCVYIKNSENNDYSVVFGDTDFVSEITVSLAEGQKAYIRGLTDSNSNFASLFIKAEQITSPETDLDDAYTSIDGLEKTKAGHYKFTAPQTGTYKFSGFEVDLSMNEGPSSFSKKIMNAGETIWLRSTCDSYNIEPATDELVYGKFVPEKTGLYKVLPYSEYGSYSDIIDSFGYYISRSYGKNTAFIGKAGEAVYFFDSEIHVELIDELECREMTENQDNYETLKCYSKTSNEVIYRNEYSNTTFSAVWYSFTANKSGVYEFYTVSDEKVSSGLYSRPDENAKLAAEKCGKRIVYGLNEGDTVYYKVSAGLDSPKSYDMFDINSKVRMINESYSEAEISVNSDTANYSGITNSGSWIKIEADETLAYTFSLTPVQDNSSYVVDICSDLNGTAGKTMFVRNPFDLKLEAGKPVYIKISDINGANNEYNLSIVKNYTPDVKRKTRIEEPVEVGFYNFNYGDNGSGQYNDYYLEFTAPSEGEYIFRTRSYNEGTLEITDDRGYILEKSSGYTEDGMINNILVYSMNIGDKVYLHVTGIDNEKFFSQSLDYEFSVGVMSTPNGSTGSAKYFHIHEAAEYADNSLTVVYTASHSGNYTIRTAVDDPNGTHLKSAAAVVNEDGNILDIVFGDINVDLAEGESVYVRCLGYFDPFCMDEGRSLYYVSDTTPKTLEIRGAHEVVYSRERYEYTVPESGEYTFVLLKDKQDLTLNISSDSGVEVTSSGDADTNQITVNVSLKAGEKVLIDIDENDFNASFNMMPYQISIVKSGSSADSGETGGSNTGEIGSGADYDD